MITHELNLQRKNQNILRYPESPLYFLPHTPHKVNIILDFFVNNSHVFICGSTIYVCIPNSMLFRYTWF